jgi:hypothetical protein
MSANDPKLRGSKLRDAWFSLAFAEACALGAIYGFLQGAWPFGIVETILAAVPINKWHVSMRRPNASNSRAARTGAGETKAPI